MAAVGRACGLPPRASNPRRQAVALHICNCTASYTPITGPVRNGTARLAQIATPAPSSAEVLQVTIERLYGHQLQNQRPEEPQAYPVRSLVTGG